MRILTFVLLALPCMALPATAQQPPAAPAAPAAPAQDGAAAKPKFENYRQPIPDTEVGFDMVAIPGGRFRMGSPANEPGRLEHEGPQVEVEVAPFWMGRCEVTWDEYDRYNTDESLPQSKKPDGMSRPTPPYTDMTFGMGKDGFPAICMTNEAARQYCIWLTRKTGRFHRLPTEAEWEYACRAGSTTAWSTGDDAGQLDGFAWHKGNSGGVYHKVGTGKPNAFGLHDMHGNVTEWCCDELIADWYAESWGKAPRVDPYAVPRRTNDKPLRYPHVVRGGSYLDEPALLRSAARRGSEPAWKQRDPQFPKSWWYFTDAQFAGFRVVRPLREPTAEERKRYENP